MWSMDFLLPVLLFSLTLCIVNVQGVYTAKLSHLLKRRQTFDPKAIPAQNFNPSSFKAESFNPSRFSAQSYNPSAYDGPDFDATKVNQLQVNRQDPTKFQLGVSGGGSAGGYNPDRFNNQVFNFLNPASHLNNKNSDSERGDTQGSSSSSYSGGSSSNNGRFNPNTLNTISNSADISQTGSMGASIGISQTVSSSGANGRSPPGVEPPRSTNYEANTVSSNADTGRFNPNAINSMSGSNTLSQSGQSGSDPVSSRGNGNSFNPNAINSMSGSNTLSQSGQSGSDPVSSRGNGNSFNPNAVNNMISGSLSQSVSMNGGSLSQTGSMTASVKFDPNSLSSMNASQTG